MPIMRKWGFPKTSMLAYLKKPPPPIVVTIPEMVNVVYLVPGVYVPPSYKPSVGVPVELPPRNRSCEPGASWGEQ